MESMKPTCRPHIENRAQGTEARTTQSQGRSRQVTVPAKDLLAQDSEESRSHSGLHVLAEAFSIWTSYLMAVARTSQEN